MTIKFKRLLLGSTALVLSISFAPLQDCQALDTSVMQQHDDLRIDDFCDLGKASQADQSPAQQEEALDHIKSGYDDIADNFVEVQNEDRKFFSEFNTKKIAGFTNSEIHAATKVIDASYEFAVYSDDFPAAEALLQQGSRVQYFGMNDADGGVFVTHKDGTAHLAFRGSANLNNWYENTKFSMVNTNEGGRYHTGFYNGYRTTKEEVWGMIEQFAALKQKTVADIIANDLVVTGHSRGGAIASVFSDIASRKYLVTPRTITFEAPRALHKKTAARYNSNARNKHLSIAQSTDPVYYVNMAILSGAKHVGTLACIPTDDTVVSSLARWHTCGSVNTVLDQMTNLGCYTDSSGNVYLLDEYNAKQRNLYAETDHSLQAYAESAVKFGGGLLKAATALTAKVGSVFSKKDATKVVDDVFYTYEVQPRMAQSQQHNKTQNTGRKTKRLAQTAVSPAADVKQDDADVDSLKEFQDFLTQQDKEKHDDEIKAYQKKHTQTQKEPRNDEVELDDTSAPSQAPAEAPQKKKSSWWKFWKKQ